jgi:DNA-binding transcriptional MerR regulator
MTESKRDRAMTEGFSGRRAAEIVGITYRQLDYWARTDLVRPSLADANGSGSRRSYSYRDLLELKVIKSLLDAGIRLESVREAFSYLRDHLGEDVTTANLVIRGSSVLVSTDEELVDVVRRGQGVLNILPLGGVKDEVDAAIVELRPLSLEVEEAVEAVGEGTDDRRAAGGDA